MTPVGRPATTPREFRITVRGRLGDRFAVAFDGMRLEPGSGQTVLVGPVADQPQLFGLLERVRNLGLELVSVEGGERQ